jgi:hypothetical protein
MRNTAPVCASTITSQPFTFGDGPGNVLMRPLLWFDCQPQLFLSFLRAGLLGRALASALLHDVRQFVRQQPASRGCGRPVLPGTKDNVVPDCVSH